MEEWDSKPAEREIKYEALRLRQDRWRNETRVRWTVGLIKLSLHGTVRTAVNSIFIQPNTFEARILPEIPV